MTRFLNRQRIRITAHGAYPELNGRTATVVRLLHSRRDVAWVATDEPLEQRHRRFPAGDDRQDHIKVYADECEEAEGGAR